MRKTAGIANWAKQKLNRSRATAASGARSPRSQRLLSVAAGVIALCALLAAVASGSTGHPTRTASDNAAAGPAYIQKLSIGAPKGAKILTATPVQNSVSQPANQQVIMGLAANGIPNVALNAYRVAATRMDTSDPGCGIDWSLLAGIGRVESNHGRYGGAVLQPDGSAVPKIIGPALNGVGFAYIADTDHGVWDTDRVYDRAVGPMQFIPGTWRSYGISASGASGLGDPANINDAALAAAHYLCVAGGDLRTLAGQRQAVMAYNHSDSYVNEVLALAAAYAAGIPVADLPMVGDTSSPVPPASGDFVHAPASPGPELGAQDNSASPPNEPTTFPANQASAQPQAQPAGQPANQPAGTAAGTGGTGGTGTATSGTGNGTTGGTGNTGGTAGTAGTGGPGDTGGTGGDTGVGGTLGGLPTTPVVPPVTVPQPPATPPTTPTTPTPNLVYTDPLCVAFRLSPTLHPLPVGDVCPTQP